MDLPEGRREPLVVLEGLTVDYGPVRALDGLTAAIGRGAVGLLGPNGAGKTTLLRVLLGFVVPSGGTVRIGGLDPRRRRDRLALREGVGYMPESDALVPGMNAVELVGTLGRLSGLRPSDAMARAHEVLDYVGFDELRYRDATGYSTGMKQRLKLAQALVHDPALLLLDEPTNGLDPKGRAHMLDLVADLGHGQGKSVLLCSHLLPDVERTCDEVLVLARGQVQESGAIASLTRDAEDAVRVAFEGDAGAVREALARRGLAAANEDGGGLLVRLPAGHADADEVFAAAEEAGVAVTKLVTVHASLEEVFLRVLAEQGVEGR